MVRLVIRFVGFLLLAVAFAALIVDGTRSIAAGALAVMPLGQTAATLAPSAFVAAQKALMARAPALWDPVLVTVLRLPAWLVIGILGILLIAASRRPRPKIGYARR